MNIFEKKSLTERSLAKHGAALDRLQAIDDIISSHKEPITLSQPTASSSDTVQQEVDAMVLKFGQQVSQSINQANMRIAAFTGAALAQKSPQPTRSTPDFVDVEAKDVNQTSVVHDIPQHSG